MTFYNRRHNSESLDRLPRVNSTHDRHTYDAIVELSEMINFYHPVFRNRSLRSRSLGSVQTVLVELALEDEDVLNQLRKYMNKNGETWFPITYYSKRYR